MIPTDKFQPAAPNSRPGVKPVFPKEFARCERCEGRLDLGIFFDGTNNNRDRDLPNKSHSNVARLYAAYANDLEKGYGRLYIPGVGTPYDDVGDSDNFINSIGGNGFAAMSERRILYGVLSVYNAVDSWLAGKKRIAPTEFFTRAQMLALCRNSERINDAKGNCTNITTQDLSVLGDDKLKMDNKGGLLHDWPGRNKYRTDFFKAQIKRMHDRLESVRTPKLVEITIDVFGFSRGAAQARAFCNWLYSLTEGDKLFGITFSIRFLGIFDTVASVGLQTGALGYTTGHMAWADPDTPGGGIKIHPRIKRVEHYIAMHENRASFPLDRVHTSPTQTLPAHVREWAFPGSHSDVGGGYASGAQGKRKGDDEKISQIPLDHMYNAARKSSVPLDKLRVLKPSETAGEGGDGFDSFAISSLMRQSYGEFMTLSGENPQTTQQWLLPYLAWQYKHLHDYQKLSFYNSASAQERAAIDSAQKRFAADIAHLQNDTNHLLWLFASPYFFLHKEAQDQLLKAWKVVFLDSRSLEFIKYYRELSPLTENFFAEYVHDSYADFEVAGTQELTGRLHWRRIFYGTEKAYLAQNNDPNNLDTKMG